MKTCNHISSSGVPCPEIHASFLTDQALTSITGWAAYSMFAESYLGKIEPGYMADFTVLSQDLSKIDPALIPSVNVHFTIVNGKVVYRK